MIERRLHNVLTYFTHRVTNAVVEGFLQRVVSRRVSERALVESIADAEPL
jgi:hypothetical protein